VETALTRRSGLGVPFVVVAAAVAAWVALVANPLMAMDLAAYVGAWSLMMTAMMLPSVLPLVLLYGRAAKPQAQVLLVLAYIAIWGATGLVAYAADMHLDVPAWTVLLAAAAYEITPLKRACLQGCRAPVDFLMSHWRRGPLGALGLGLEHAAYCVGCCWALMAVLVLAAAMSLWWAAALAGVLFVQKVLPAPRWSPIATAAGLVVVAVLTEVLG
jgi:predicted metal-binding membrane protein